MQIYWGVNKLLSTRYRVKKSGSCNESHSAQGQLLLAIINTYEQALIASARCGQSCLKTNVKVVPTFGHSGKLCSLREAGHPINPRQKCDTRPWIMRLKFANIVRLHPP